MQATPARQQIYTFLCAREPWQKICGGTGDHHGQWLFLLKNLPRLLDRPAALRDRIFSRIFDTVDFSDLDDIEQQNHKRAMDTWRDTQLQIEYAAEVAREEGIAQGKAEGVKEGEEQGKREGILKVAKNFLKMGLSADDVAKATGLTPNELAKLSLQ